MLPRDVLTIFPPDDRVALFVASLCMASNDVEDGLVEVESFNPGEAEDPDTFHRRRFSYRVRMLNGHLYEGTAALKAWRQAESGVIGPEALRAVRQNSFHYPHPDSKRLAHLQGIRCEAADGVRFQHIGDTCVRT